MNETSAGIDAPPARPAERLIAIAGEVPGPKASLTTALEARGYAVRWSPTGAGLIEQMTVLEPSAVVASAQLPDMTGIEVCRRLTSEFGVSAVVPILLIPAEPLEHDERLAALMAGAWECFDGPPDFEELLLKLERWIRASHETRRARAEALVDPATGLYNQVGLARRAKELGSLGSRQHAALACVALALQAAETEAVESAPTGAATRCGHVLRSIGRTSDVIGRLGPSEFVVLAPGTDAAGAMRLAHRLVHGLHQALVDAADMPVSVTVRAGFEAVPNLSYAPIEPVDLLAHATTALRTGRVEGGFGWMRQAANISARPH